MKFNDLFFIGFNLSLFLLSISLLGAPLAYAEQHYQTEVSISYFSTTVEDSDPGDQDDKIKVHAIELKQHFSPVKSSEHPLAEAAFLERIGSFQLFYGTLEMEFEPNISLDGPTYGAAFTFMQPGQSMVIRGIYFKSDQAFDFPLVGDSVTRGYGLGVGVFIRDGLFIGLEHARLEQDLNVTGPGGTVTLSGESDQYALSTKWVKPLEHGTAINIEGEIGVLDNDDGDTNTLVELSGDYYFNPQTSLGGGLSFNTGDNKGAEGKTLTLNVDIFITHYTALGLAFERFYAENTKGNDDRGFGVALLVRF